ncbi:hypothetical protein ACFVH6_03160 [Spirillospora sp. NPDC127200]
MSATRPTSGPTVPSPTAMPPKRPVGDARPDGPENAAGARPGATPGTVPHGTAGRSSGESAEPTRAEVAERVAAAVRWLPDVADLNAGALNRIVTYRAGAPVSGVAVRDREVEVGVTARYGRPFPEVGEAVRAAVLPLAGDRRVNVEIVDIADQDDQDDQDGRSGRTGEGDA